MPSSLSSTDELQLHELLAESNARADRLEMELLAGSASREVLRLELMREESAARARAELAHQKQAELTQALQEEVCIFCMCVCTCACECECVCSRLLNRELFVLTHCKVCTA
jgi:hypothetical protein